jgi:hypothetical protein
MRRIVGYEPTEPDEDGRRRLGRPIFEDLGQGRTRLTNQGGAYGGPIEPAASTVLTRGQRAPSNEAPPPPAPHMQPIGVGPVERRQITPDELAARRAAEERPSPIKPRPAVITRKPIQMLEQPTAPAPEIARLAVEAGKKRTPEQRARIQAGIVASFARRRAAATASSGVPE